MKWTPDNRAKPLFSKDFPQQDPQPAVQPSDPTNDCEEKTPDEPVVTPSKHYTGKPRGRKSNSGKRGGRRQGQSY